MASHDPTRSKNPEAESDAIPPGWTYNPASWPQRMPIILTAVLGFFIAAYLGLYQLDVISHVWEPFFGDGTRIVLESWVSKGASDWVGMPDAMLGALGYLADAVAGAIGGTRRWKTMPWIVVLFGIFIGPLGLVSITLVILQPFVGGWCTLCLVTAIISVVMIGPAMDEVLASLQHLRRSHDEGRSFWRTFWGLEAEAPAITTVHARTAR